MIKRSTFSLLASVSVAFVLTSHLHAADAEPAAWWNPDWTQRQSLTLDTGADAAAVTDSAGAVTVLVRLHDGNFQFVSAREDGSDLRFIAADGKTVLSHQVESFDNLLNEAFVWVKLPDVKPATKETIHIYYGNADAAMPAPEKPTDAYDADTILAYHFAARGAAPADSTANANNSDTVATTAESSLIGNGLRLLGSAPVLIPNSPSLEWKAGQALTISTWIKPAALQENAVIFSRADGQNSLRLLLDQGIPVIQLGSVRSQPGAPLAPIVWSHLALVADGKTLKLFVNGASYASIDGALPALTTPLSIGGLVTETAGTTSFTGELDELTISKIARSDSWVKLTLATQGNSDAAQRTLSVGMVEAGEGGGEHSGAMAHVMLFGDIAKNMMFDGWIAIGVCVIMIIVGWTVAVKKFLYLNSIEKGTRIFLKKWKELSTDLTALDTEDNRSVSTLGGQVDDSDQSDIQKSPLFHIYQIGADEIRHRLDKDNTRVQGLSGRSIQAIRASLDAGLVHETHRLSDGLVYLTISIAGGPYVGLLGTVVGVMITFAIIAKSGEVNVNSIAPGIASALLATVVGLVVAIPALFIYSYLNGRIKNSLGLMQVFIDEFVAKMAEFYRPPNAEADSNGGGHH
jgi:biopolymer transport protein ExbB